MFEVALFITIALCVFIVYKVQKTISKQRKEALEKQIEYHIVMPIPEKTAKVAKKKTTKKSYNNFKVKSAKGKTKGGTL